MQDFQKRLVDMGAFLGSVVLSLIVLDVFGIIEVNWFPGDNTSQEFFVPETTRDGESAEQQQRQASLAQKPCVKPSQPKLPKALLPEITIGPWTLNKEPIGNIASDFIGAWSGNVVQTGSVRDEYPVVLAIWQGAINECVGTVNYATEQCGGDLFLDSATYLRIVVAVRLTSGLTQCLDRFIITLTKNTEGTLEYNAELRDLAATAVLKKVSH